MYKIVKHILVFLLLPFLFSSCLTIEKRKYMNGYHVEWISKKKITADTTGMRHCESRCNRDEASDSYRNPQKDLGDCFARLRMPQPSLAMTDNEKNILIEIQKPKIVQIVFRNDILIEKNKKLDFKKEKNSKHTLSQRQMKFIGIFLGLIALAALVFYYSILLPWMIALCAGLILLSLALIIPDKKNGNINEEKNDNREIPLIAIIAYIIQFLPLGFLLAIILYIISINKIKNNPEKYKGMSFVIGGLIISIVFLLFYSFLILVVFKVI